MEHIRGRIMRGSSKGRYTFMLFLSQNDKARNRYRCGLFHVTGDHEVGNSLAAAGRAHAHRARTRLFAAFFLAGLFVVPTTAYFTHDAFAVHDFFQPTESPVNRLALFHFYFRNNNINHLNGYGWSRGL